LGLALVKQILKLEGGRVSVSDAEIGGAKFTVALRADIPKEE
jgi:signal transduction histidine kinase